MTDIAGDDTFKLRLTVQLLVVDICMFAFLVKPSIAAMHGPHSLVRLDN